MNVEYTKNAPAQFHSTKEAADVCERVTVHSTVCDTLKKLADAKALLCKLDNWVQPTPESGSDVKHGASECLQNDVSRLSEIAGDVLCLVQSVIEKVGCS